MGLFTRVSTHVWDPANKIAQRAGERIAGLPYDVPIRISFHLYHQDVLEGEEDVVEKYTLRFTNAIGTLLPQRPALLFFSHGIVPEVSALERDVWVRLRENLISRYGVDSLLCTSWPNSNAAQAETIG